MKDIAFFTTLAGYIHWKLSGEKVLGIGEAAGMFPIDSTIMDFDQKMLDQFDDLHHFDWKIRDILPKVLVAGEACRCPDRRRGKITGFYRNFAARRSYVSSRG